VCIYITFILHSFRISIKPTQKQLQNPSPYIVAIPSSCNPKKKLEQTVSSGKFIDTRGHLDGWFGSMHESESDESIDRYLLEFSRKIINTPKFVRLSWLKFEMMLEVSEQLEQ